MTADEVVLGTLRDTRADAAYFLLSHDNLSYGIESSRRKVGNLESKADNPTRYALHAGLYFLTTLDLIQWSYSTGAPLEDIRQQANEMFDAYCLRQTELIASKPQELSFGYGRDAYLKSLRVLSLAILLDNQPERVKKIIELTDNDGVDAVYDRLAESQGVERHIGSELAWPRPYARLLAVFEAAEVDRPARMREFLEVWYAQNRGADWWGEHLRIDVGGLGYTGYWCFEAAAVVKILGIDDSTFRDNEYYPADLLPREDGDLS